LYHLMNLTILLRRTEQEKRGNIDAALAPSASTASQELADWQIEIDCRMAQH
jgi:hypothetical protein